MKTHGVNNKLRLSPVFCQISPESVFSKQDVYTLTESSRYLIAKLYS